MAIKKSDLYSSIWASCDELRGGMDASQYKDFVLFIGPCAARMFMACCCDLLLSNSYQNGRCLRFAASTPFSSPRRVIL
jgi:hypothetical protein